MKNNRVFRNIETRELGFYKNGFFTVGENTIQTGCEPSSEFWEEAEDYVLKTEEGYRVFTKALNYYTVSENLEISYSGYFEGIDRMFKVFAKKENAEIARYTHCLNIDYLDYGVSIKVTSQLHVFVPYANIHKFTYEKVTVPAAYES